AAIFWVNGITRYTKFPQYIDTFPQGRSKGHLAILKCNVFLLDLMTIPCHGRADNLASLGNDLNTCLFILFCSIGAERFLLRDAQPLEQLLKIDASFEMKADILIIGIEVLFLLHSSL